MGGKWLRRRKIQLHRDFLDGRNLPVGGCQPGGVTPASLKVEGRGSCPKLLPADVARCDRVKNCPGPFQRGDIWVTSSGPQTGLGVKCLINVNGAGLGKGISSTCLWKWKIHPGSEPLVLKPSSGEAKQGWTVWMAQFYPFASRAG